MGAASSGGAHRAPSGENFRGRSTFLVFGAPSLENEDIAEVLLTLRSGWLGRGPKVAQFEQAFSRYRQGAHALALNSCTAALHLALIGAGVGPGDEVITTPMTFCATVNAILHAGAKPVLADVDRATGNIDPSAVAAAITPRTRALVPVHLAGHPCDMDRLVAIAERHGLALIEDCAHAIEATHRDQAVGTFGAFGAFSFYVTKNLTTGEGGMLLIRDSDVEARLRVLSLHGMDRHAWERFGTKGYRHYAVTEMGYKYNMTDIQAAIGLRQLGRIEQYLRRRESIWQIYNASFSDLPVTRPAAVPAHQRHARHLYTLRVPPSLRDSVIEGLTQRNIGTGVHYLSIPEHPFYRESLGWHPDAWPVARDIGRSTLSLPLSPHLTDEDVADVVEATREVVHELSR